MTEWYEPPTMAGIRGALFALALLAWTVAPSSSTARKHDAKRHGEGEKKQIHIVFYGNGLTGEPISHCLAEFRWIYREPFSAHPPVWLENDECENPLHPLDEWQTCDFEMRGYWQTEHELSSITYNCYGPVFVEVRLKKQDAI